MAKVEAFVVYHSSTQLKKSTMNSDQQPFSHTNLDALRQFDTPTICNAIELFDVRSPTSGYTDRRIAACFPDLPPMVGYAATATFRSAEPMQYSGEAQRIGFRLIESFANLPGPAIVVFQDIDDPPVAATFGDGMCLTYQSFGAVGLIASGAARDLDNIRTLNFPCYSDGTICAHGHCHFESINIPVRVGGLTIHPGDLLHGDCNGITTIPHEIADTVPYACTEFLKAEAVVLDRLREGNTDLAGHEKAINEMKRLLIALKEELAAKNKKA